MLLRSDTHIDLFDTEDGKETTTKINITKTQILSSLAVSMGSMIVGYSSAWSSPAIADLMKPGSYLEVGYFIKSYSKHFIFLLIFFLICISMIRYQNKKHRG